MKETKDRREAADLIIAPRWIAPMDPAFPPETLLKDQAVVIRQGKIIAIPSEVEAHARFVAKESIVLDTHILIPGLINLHGHAATSLMRGMSRNQPNQQGIHALFPAEQAARIDRHFVLDGTRLACAEMLLGGITTFSDTYLFPDAAAEAAKEYGIKINLALWVAKQPSNYATDFEDYLDKALALRDCLSSESTLSFSLAPLFINDLSDEQLLHLASLAEEMQLPMHCVLHESRSEIEESLAAHGATPIERLARLQIISPSLIVCYAAHTDAAAMLILGKSGAHIAHCPSNTLKSGAGLADVISLQKAGINIGLGGGSALYGKRFDLFREMRISSLLAKGLHQDARLLPAHETLQMATYNAALALGLSEKTGSVTVGKAADLCAVQLNEIDKLPYYDPIEHLVHIAAREQVSHVWVNGFCCVNNKKLEKNTSIRLESSVALWQNSLEV